MNTHVILPHMYQNAINSIFSSVSELDYNYMNKFEYSTTKF